RQIPTYRQYYRPIVSHLDVWCDHSITNSMHRKNAQQRTRRKKCLGMRGQNMRTITNTNHERGVIIRRSLALVAFSTLAFLATVRAGRSGEASPESAVKNVVLVHGAFADGSSYAR